MAASDFFWFGTGVGANVESQAGYASDPQTSAGYTAGTTASSPKLNKSWRQATMASALIGKIIVDQLGADCLDDGNLAAIEANFLSALAAILTPVGSILFYAKNAVPTGFLPCDGSAVSRTTYARLAALASSISYGAPFGPGDGSTTFNVPDLRGQFVRSFDSGGSIDPGRTFGSTQADTVKAHKHISPWGENDYPPSRVSPFGETSQNDQWGAASDDQDNPLWYTNDGSIWRGNDPNSGSGVIGSETRPKNVALLACIKF